MTAEVAQHLEGLKAAELVFLNLVVHSGLDNTEAWRRANKKTGRTATDRQKAYDWRIKRPQLIEAIDIERTQAVKRSGVTRDRLIQAYQDEAFVTSAQILDPYTSRLHEGLEPGDFAAVESIKYSAPGEVAFIKMRNPDRARQKLEEHLAAEQAEFKLADVPEIAFSFLPPGGNPDEHYVLATENTITLVMSDAQRRWLYALTQANELFLGGAAGGGKSDAERIFAFVCCMLIKNVRVVLIRRTRGELEDNHMESVRGFTNFLAPLEARGLVDINQGKLRIRFRHTGASIKLKHFQYEKSYQNYHGGEGHVYIFDELTTFTENMYRRVRGRARKVGIDTSRIERLLPGIKFPLMISASNPGMAGHAWVKRTFISGKLPHKTYEMDEAEGGMFRRYEPALYHDNPWLLRDDPDYIKKIKGLGNPAYVKALLEGNWDIVAGGMFSDIWHPDVHIVKPFRIPASWTITRGYDHGIHDPFAVLWMAESDGTECTLADGSTHVYPRGTRFFVAELYGAGAKGKGLGWTVKQISAEIKRIENSILDFHHVKRIENGPADTVIWNGQKQGRDIASEFAAQGIHWDRALKAPGSRAMGWELMAGDLQLSLQGGAGIYFFEQLVESGGIVTELREAPRDEANPSDLPKGYPDHGLDVGRYLITHKPKRAGSAKQRMF